MQQLCQWLYTSDLGTGIRESVWIFPIVETVHVLGIALLVGTVAILDCRLLGMLFKREAVSQVVRQILPLTWAGFGIMLISGFLLFSAEATDSYTNPAFRIKLIMLLLAGLNPLVFHLTVYRRVTEWNHQPITPLHARLAGCFSLTLWCGVICAGRAMAYIQK